MKTSTTKFCAQLLPLIFFIAVITLPSKGYSKKMNALMAFTAFYSPDNGPFIETYLSVAGNSVNFIKKENGKFQSSIQVIVLFKKGEDIVNYDKYELFSPELDDTLDMNFSFLDQQRYSLANGNYDFEVEIRDKNSEDKSYINLQPIEVNFPDDEVTLSGIQFVKSYTPTEENNILSKNSYDLVPYISNFYPQNENKIIYYCELYNTPKVLGEGSKFLVKSYLTPVDKDEPLDAFVKYKKEAASKVGIIFSELDISNLKSGNYFLVIEVRDHENKLIGANRIFFQRSNPRLRLKDEDIVALNIEQTFANKITDIDTLSEYIRCLAPISSEQEKNFAQVHLKSAKLDILQKYFYKFWSDRNSLNPEEEWLKYLNEVNKVNLAYSTSIQKGYETDRGRVYLHYGPPNAISESYNEPSTYPYEIWHYYVLENGQRNKRFVFYTKDIVTNDFMLLHSDVSGELSNYRWQYVLYQRVDPGFDLDQSEVPASWGGNSKKYFDLPR